jgi:protocatechuate 3,4-dioxygenase, alpha subunit
VSLERTPSQTVGPYLAIALDWPDGPTVVPQGTPGSFWIRGRLLDGNGDAVPDGLVETWQADNDGRFPGARDAGPFRGFGRCATGPEGEFGIHTLKPGRVDGDGGIQAPHIDVGVFARGILKRLVTRIYFADEAAANQADPVLSRMPESARATLVATVADDGYRFDIRLQGEGETAFFHV